MYPEEEATADMESRKEETQRYNSYSANEPVGQNCLAVSLVAMAITFLCIIVMILTMGSL